MAKLYSGLTNKINLFYKLQYYYVILKKYHFIFVKTMLILFFSHNLLDYVGLLIALRGNFYGVTNNW